MADYYVDENGNITTKKKKKKVEAKTPSYRVGIDGNISKVGNPEAMKTTYSTPKDIDGYLSVYSNSDFKNNSVYVGTKSKGIWEKLGSKYGMGYNDLQYEYINNQNGIRDEIDRKAITWGSDTGKTDSSYKEKALDYMTEDEVAVYNYYYHTSGKEKAQEFLDALAETLNERKAGKDFSKMQGKTAQEIAYGLVAGVEQFEQGVKNLGNMMVGNDDYIPQTSAQILSSKIREDLADNGGNVLGSSFAQVGFDVLNTGANMIPSIAVGAANPVAGAILMGASAAGNAYQEDLNESNDVGKSRAYATTIGVLEGTLQYFLGGIDKLGGVSSTITRATSGIKNGALRFAMEYGGKIASEALEEGLQEVLDPLVKNAIHGTDESVDWQEVAYSALLGGLMGGVFGASEVSQTHLNANEQAVVDKVYKDRIAEEEKNGKLTSKRKSEIYDDVIEQMQQGNISTDTIEEVLGGETYKAFKQATDKEKAVVEELATMYKGEELQAEVEKFLEGSESVKIKEQLSKEVFGKVKDRWLGESYYEGARKNERYTADVSKYDDAQRAVIQKAIDSGVLNNTRRTHEFVDLVAKISADKGVLFDFVNNERLKTSGFAVGDGKVVNGYVTEDGNVVLNVNAAKSLNKVVGHEITHVLEGTELYGELQTILFDYAKSRKATSAKFDNEYIERLAAVRELYKNVKGYEGVSGIEKMKMEVAADLVGDYLFTDADFVRNLSTKHRNIAQKIYDEVKYMLKLATAGSKEARDLERVKRAFEDAWRADGKSDGEQKLSLSSMGNTFFGDPNISADAFEEGNYKDTDGYKNYVEQSLNNYRQSRGAEFDEATARKSIEDSIDGIVRVALAAKRAGYDIFDDPKSRSIKDSKKRLLFSSLEPNSDYFTSNDISTICDKRKNFAEIYDDIVRAEEAKGVPAGKRFFDNVDNYFYLHQLMAEKGLTQPCRQCYVESMRKNLAPMATAFLDLVQETDPDNLKNKQLWQKAKKSDEIYVIGADGKRYTKKVSNTELREKVMTALEAHPEYNLTVDDFTVEMLTTANGLAQLKIQAPLIYEYFNSFYGQAKPKMPKSPTPFRFGELTALLTDHNGKINEKLINKINHTGGFRLQSYSDFQIQNYTDVLQVLFEAGTLGLRGHAYTKVPAFLDATEGTNLKRNISIFMYKDGKDWKLDRNDSFPYALEEIYDIVNNDKSGNTSIIAVSQNDDMTAWIMANDYVGYGIPFHKSGIKMGTVRDTDVTTEDGRTIKGYSGIKDHTRQQSEVYADSKKKVKKGIDIYEFWDFENSENLSKNELIEKNVKRYIDECEKAGYLPKFRDYVMNKDGIVNKVLSYAKKLGFAPADATIDDISFEYKGYRIPYGYYKFLGDFGMFTPDGLAAPQKTLSLDGFDFDKAEQFFADAEDLRRTEILQQFSNGAERRRYRESNLTAEQLTEIVKQKRNEIASQVVGEDIAPRAYSLSTDSEGNQLSYEQQEYFKDSKMRDENGILKVMYHGTPNGGHYAFDPNYSDDGISLFFVDGNDVASSYSGTSETFAPRLFKTADDVNAFFAEIGKRDYRVVEEDGKYVLYDDDFEVSTSESLDDIFEDFKDWEGVGYGSVNYKVYLNLKNPLVVDAEGRDWNALPAVSGDKTKYEYIKVVEVGDRGEVTIEYSMTGDPAPTTETVDLYKKFDDGLADTLSNLAPGESVEGIYTNPSTTRDYARYAKDNNYDGVIFKNIYDIGGYGNNGTSEATVAIAFDSNQVKSVANTNPTADRDIRRSLSYTGEKEQTHGTYNVRGEEVAFEDYAPIREDVEPTPVETAPTETEVAPTPAEAAPTETEIAPTPAEESLPIIDKETAETEQNVPKTDVPRTEADMFPDEQFPESDTDFFDRTNSFTDDDAPPVRVVYNDSQQEDAIPLTKKLADDIRRDVRNSLEVTNSQVATLRKIIDAYANGEYASRDELFDVLKRNFGTYTESFDDETVREAKSYLRTTGLDVDRYIKGEMADYAKDVMRRNWGKLKFAKKGLPVDSAYQELSRMFPHLFPEDIVAPTDMLATMVEVANMNSTTETEIPVDDEAIYEVADRIISKVTEYRQQQTEKLVNRHSREAFDSLMADADSYVPPIDPNLLYRNRRNPIGAAEDSPVIEQYENSQGQQAMRFPRQTPPGTTEAVTPAHEIHDTEHKIGVVENQQAVWEEPVPETITRAVLHERAINRIDDALTSEGGLEKVLKNAKNLSTFTTVDNTPQRVFEKAFGRKAGKIISDLTVNAVAQSTTDGIRWLNTITAKDGLLDNLVKQYGIKPGTKESAIAQIYAEGYYVDDAGEVVRYGDVQLLRDVPDVDTRSRIKRLVADPSIRHFYDETLDIINEARVRNGYDPIPRLDNYYLHFRAQTDTFSQMGLPFNPNDIKAKDLPTDLNGITADLKPGKPFFASEKHRKGLRTTHDLLGGLERYATSAMPQIYYIDHIQTLRALRNHIANIYGQATDLDEVNLSEDDIQAIIQKRHDSHLSTMAKFLNEEANILAGKTALIDRSVEGILGRRGLTFFDTVRKQSGSNQVGLNISSSLTNFEAVARAFAKSNKIDFIKGFSQFASNKIRSIFGQGDTFAEDSPLIVRRKGAEKFYRTPWEKIRDVGYVPMGIVDDIATELIARTKYTELTRKGMDSQQAHIETDKWASRLMGDRSLGQMPQIFNSKTMGAILQFQLEVRNTLDSNFYDTIQDANESTEHIENKLQRNATKAAKITATLVELAIAQHLFGKAFESIAGYNPTFDIIDVLIKTFGWDDDEEDEDTVKDNLAEGFKALLEDLPYSSTLTGGRIPMSAALPITEMINGTDQYGNEKAWWKTGLEALPYYFMPTGYGQIKKTAQGLDMFSDEHPIAGSYTRTDAFEDGYQVGDVLDTMLGTSNKGGNMRFPVEDTLGNRIQAGLFGQYANENARYYFDNDIAPMSDKQIAEYAEVDIPIRDYWDYREGFKGKDTLGEKVAYISNLDLPIWKKNILVNNQSSRKEPIDLADYNDYDGWGEFDYAQKYPEKYDFLEANGISVEEFESFDDDTKEAYNWAYQNPEKFKMSKAVTDDVAMYKWYTTSLNDIKADKDANGKTISGSAKEKKIAYINSLNLGYEASIVLFKAEYPADDTYNKDIINYIESRADFTFEDKKTILTELGFTVTDDGKVTWD